MYASLFLLESQCLCRLVAYVAWSPILYRTGIYIASILCPLVALSSKSLERLAVELNKSLANNRLHLAITTLHVHHHGNWHASSLPLIGTCLEVLHDGHVACLAIGNELCSACT